MTGRIAVRDASGVVPPPPRLRQRRPARRPSGSPTSPSIPPRSRPDRDHVAWTNDDAVPHTATALDGAFDSGIFDPGASFSQTFADPGTYEYRCNLHPQMTGTIVVEGEPTGAPPAEAAAPAAQPEPESGAAEAAVPEAAPSPAATPGPAAQAAADEPVRSASGSCSSPRTTTPAWRRSAPC
jgi:hypothetical protein